MHQETILELIGNYFDLADPKALSLTDLRRGDIVFETSDHKITTPIIAVLIHEHAVEMILPESLCHEPASILLKITSGDISRVILKTGNKKNRAERPITDRIEFYK